jgi:AAA domain
MSSSDIPAELSFVDPTETDDTYRVVLWAPPGQGKSVVAASAPGPILVLSADRPSAYRFARKHHAPKEIRETRYEGPETLDAVWRYLRDHPEIKTFVLDPFTNVYDKLVDVAPAGREGDPDWQWVNKKLLGFVQSLRAFRLNVVIVAHEKLNDGKKGDGKLYPALGGPALINKILAEMDICAYVEMRRDAEGQVRVIGQLQPRDNLVCKESTAGGELGARRVADLTRWFELASEALRPQESDLPWVNEGEAVDALRDALDATEVPA